MPGTVLSGGQLSRQKANKLLALTPAWMDGKITVYQVAKQSGVVWHTAKKWLPIYAERIKKNEALIVQRIVEKSPEEENLTTWQKIQKAILKYIITEA